MHFFNPKFFLGIKSFNKPHRNCFLQYECKLKLVVGENNIWKMDTFYNRKEQENSCQKCLHYNNSKNVSWYIANLRRWSWGDYRYKCILTDSLIILRYDHNHPCPIFRQTHTYIKTSKFLKVIYKYKTCILNSDST